jgi:hypothetical protein
MLQQKAKNQKRKIDYRHPKKQSENKEKKEDLSLQALNYYLA